MDRGDWRATVHEIAEWDMIEASTHEAISATLRVGVIRAFAFTRQKLDLHITWS